MNQDLVLVLYLLGGLAAVYAVIYFFGLRTK
jgi:uncharacterized membrane protein YuzA (DUF378 family)